MRAEPLSQWCVMPVNTHSAVCASHSSRGGTACLAHVLSVDVLVVPPTCWIFFFAPMHKTAGFFCSHKTAGYLPVLCLFLINSANRQVSHYSHAYAALYLLQSWSLCFLLLMSIRMCDVGYEMHLHRKPCTAY